MTGLTTPIAWRRFLAYTLHLHSMAEILLIQEWEKRWKEEVEEAQEEALLRPSRGRHQLLLNPLEPDSRKPLLKDQYN